MAPLTRAGLRAVFRRQLLVAARNARRNARRTAITLLAIAAGTSALVVFGGYMDYAFWGLRETTIRNHLGHLQIVRVGYFERRLADPKRALLTVDEAEAVQRIIGAFPEVETIARRLEIHGLIGNGETTVPFLARGIEPERETASQAWITAVEGALLMGRHDPDVVLAKGLAAALDVRVGDRVTLLATTLGGALNGIDASVAGIFETGAEEFDQRAVLMALPLASRLLGSERLDRIVVMLRDTELTDAVAARAKAALAAAELRVEVKRWSELATFYRRVVGIYEAMYTFVAIVIVVIVVLSITNTIAMAVFERTREIGTLMALGIRPARVIEIFVFEALLIGVAGGGVGVMVGVACCVAVNALGGIPVAPPPGATRGYIAYLNLVPRVIAGSLALAILTALAGSLYPALRAARLAVAPALRHT